MFRVDTKTKGWSSVPWGRQVHIHLDVDVDSADDDVDEAANDDDADYAAADDDAMMMVMVMVIPKVRLPNWKPLRPPCASTWGQRLAS